jgi:hypothetical protein
MVEDAARDEAEMRADLTHRGWVSSLRHELPDAIEHFALSGGERWEHGLTPLKAEVGYRPITQIAETQKWRAMPDQYHTCVW